MKVIITGASRGIGAAMVECFAEAGHEVHFLYNNSQSEAMDVAHRTGAAAYRCDVSDSAAVKRVFDEIGDADVLCNNAGISEFALFTDITEQMWRRMLDVNVTGAFNCAKAVLPAMIRKKSGSVINISSIWGVCGASCEVHYSTSKAALIGMTKALAKELAPSGINVNCIAPGVVDTDMNAQLDSASRAALISEIPAGRFAKAREIAKTALFLASPDASYITGQVIVQSGGFAV